MEPEEVVRSSTRPAPTATARPSIASWRTRCAGTTRIRRPTAETSSAAKRFSPRIVDAASALTGNSTRLELHALIADGGLVTALVRWSATMQGRSMEGQEAAVYKVVGSRIVEAWIHPADQAASDAFFTR